MAPSHRDTFPLHHLGTWHIKDDSLTWLRWFFHGPTLGLPYDTRFLLRVEDRQTFRCSLSTCCTWKVGKLDVWWKTWIDWRRMVLSIYYLKEIDIKVIRYKTNALFHDSKNHDPRFRRFAPAPPRSYYFSSPERYAHHVAPSMPGFRTRNVRMNVQTALTHTLCGKKNVEKCLQKGKHFIILFMKVCWAT